MGDLSEHFSRREFACRHCGEVKVADGLLSGLEALRKYINSPVIVVSGYRCPEHNAAVGGKQRSRHVVGDAADIRVGGMLLSQLFLKCAAIADFHSGGIGIYPDDGFVHVDCRGQRARWGQIGGVYVPFLTAWDSLRAKEVA